MITILNHIFDAFFLIVDTCIKLGIDIAPQITDIQIISAYGICPSNLKPIDLTNEINMYIQFYYNDGISFERFMGLIPHKAKNLSHIVIIQKKSHSISTTTIPLIPNAPYITRKLNKRPKRHLPLFNLIDL